MAARLLSDAYARLDAVGAIDARDAERLVDLGVRRERIEVTGDTRYDQVWARVRGVDRAAGLVAMLTSDRPTLVAGSTWPADERPLLAAWSRVRAGGARGASHHRAARADGVASRRRSSGGQPRPAFAARDSAAMTRLTRMS